MMKGWSVQVYERHVGIVDEEGCTVCAIAGKRGDPQIWKNANKIVEAVNQVFFSGKLSECVRRRDWVDNDER